MSILARFTDIMSANVNAALDKLEDPSKMVDQYLENMIKELAAVKSETAKVMAEENRVKRLLIENKSGIEKYLGLAEKALLAGNEEDATIFLAKKQELEGERQDIQATFNAAHENANKMRAMHDKLVKDINGLRARKDMIKAKAAVAKTQETVNKFSSPNSNRGGAEAFNRLEDKVNSRLDAASSMAELNTEPMDEAKELESKYRAGASATNVSCELAELKAKLGLTPSLEN